MKREFLKEEIKALSLKDSNYPELLKTIQDPPRVLYARGEVLKNEAFFAIVGTRKCSDYGREIAFWFAKELSEAGLTIVSGMARGIDALVHKGAIEGNGRTVAVLGTGLDEKYIYPQENLKLAENILKNKGCLVSEYPPSTSGRKFTFLRRNRIISGMSLGILVVEAKFKSGALNTACWAKSQKRKIFAIPGSVFSKNSKGCHCLIQQGAKLVQTPQDILKELKITNQKARNQKRKRKSVEEELILSSLQKGALPVDKIIEITKLSPQQTLSTLALMEAESKIKNIGGDVYIKI